MRESTPAGARATLFSSQWVSFGIPILIYFLLFVFKTTYNGLDFQQKPSQRTGVKGGLPFITLITFLTASSAIALRASSVALPRCGKTITFGNLSNSGFTWGSFSNTSNPAAFILSAFKCFIRCFSLISSPLAVLINIG